MKVLSRRSLSMAASATMFAGVLAGCGKPAVTDALARLTAAEAVNAAAVTGFNGSYEYTLQSTTHIAGVGLPAEQQATLGSVPTIVINATGAVESPGRSRIDMTSGSGSKVYMVVYDGTFYVSPDGTSYKDAPALSQMLSTLSTQQMQDLARHATHVVDAGRVTVDGVSGERFDGTVDPSFMTAIVGKMAGPLGSAIGAPSGVMDKVMNAMHVDTLSLSFVINHATGHLMSETSHTTVSLDFTAVGRALGAPDGKLTGTLTMSGDTTMTTHDFGGHIVVPHPTSTGSITPQEFGRLFAGAAAL